MCCGQDERIKLRAAKFCRSTRAAESKVRRSSATPPPPAGWPKGVSAPRDCGAWGCVLHGLARLCVLRSSALSAPRAPRCALSPRSVGETWILRWTAAMRGGTAARKPVAPSLKTLATVRCLRNHLRLAHPLAPATPAMHKCTAPAPSPAPPRLTDPLSVSASHEKFLPATRSRLSRVLARAHRRRRPHQPPALPA